MTEWRTYKLEELDTIAFECPNCGTETAFRIIAVEIVYQQPRMRMCSGCNRELPGVGELVGIYCDFYAKGKGKITFRVSRVMRV